MPRCVPGRPTRSRRRPLTHTIAAVLIAALTPLGLLPVTAGDAVAQANSSPACSVAALNAGLHVPNVVVSSAALNTTGTVTGPGVTTPITGLPTFCDVSLVQADQAGNRINIEIWLPAPWNGSFQGVGGGGYSCGVILTSLASAIKQHYSTGSTDCGHTDFTGSFALNPDGTLNKPLIADFASVGIHDMTVAGKAVTAAYYRQHAQYSYFNGCSTGGREGLMEAQKYPADYNGIVSGAPAINWTKFIPAEIWPELVMKQRGDFLPACKEAAFTEAVVKACDALDGVTDGVIADPAKCDWNPRRLVGMKTPCGTITETDADVVAQIWAGPVSTNGRKLWYGLEPGTSFAGLAATTTTGGAPFPIATTWLGTWLQRNRSWDWHTLTYQRFDQLFSQSVAEFSDVIATDNPDLSAFERHGGKIVIWHGLADQLIFPQGTVNYYQRLQHAMGGARPTDSFARLFLAPGAVHCTSGAGPAPTDPLGALVSWVRHGKAPAQLEADLVDPTTGVPTESRILCAYPEMARYTGHGSTNDAKNFRCE